MFDIQNPRSGQMPTSNTSLDLVRRYFRDHGAALTAAASLLGGAKWESRCIQLMFRVDLTADLQDRHLHELAAFGRLLNLDRASDLDSEEAAQFTKLSPCDPVVHELCLLTDRFRDLLEQINQRRGADFQYDD
ncbi:hypothetical protein [Antarcticimicrobium luteum]|uniref:Uncharacterized protein n=1 Tax=Antarcticimicrobium luteum TaxID=2547397 RepID=A0A4R5UXM4_9RHOB|nr:hypothetical protein [Antarcticimicrobium luteum]TDK43836.1 hypothetical protein E1832_16290 [Antarcticimicrobium luteum]